MKQLAQEGEVDNLENLKMKNKIKELEENITLDNLCEYIESLEKSREERKYKLQIELETLLDIEFASF